MTNLSECEIKGLYDRFDVPAEKCEINVLRKLSMPKAEFGAIQLGQYMCIILGLEFSPHLTADGKCFCGLPNDSSGYHGLNRSR